MNININSNSVIICIIVINVILLILYVLNTIKLFKLRKNYSDFMYKLGNGNNVIDMLENYVKDVEKVNNENKEIKEYCKTLSKMTDSCIHKIGLIRYNAYKDTGSNLSFALALLNENNNGVVLNGIYSRDTSNIYCKTVKNGKSEYALSSEEEQAIGQAIEVKYYRNKTD